jgi:hypothetical protein
VLTYLVSLTTVLLALLQLAKDWGAHQTTLRRALVLVTIMFLGIGGAINAHYTSQQSAAQHLEDQKRIVGLETAVHTANANQDANTKQFVKSFRDLTTELSDLEVQVKTADLQKEALQLRKELEATQKALSPPKAELEASLVQVTGTTENLAKEISVPQSPDGTVEFIIAIANKSAVQAKSGSIFVRLCEECVFSVEPERFTKPVGAPNFDREMLFQAINVTTVIKVPLKVRPPLTTKRFEVGITARCENCTVRPTEHVLVNH